MTELSREDEILLREYAQAGEACRANDTLVRTGLTIFGGVQAAIIGFVASRGDTSITVEMILLELLGLWLRTPPVGSTIAIKITWNAPDVLSARLE